MLRNTSRRSFWPRLLLLSLLLHAIEASPGAITPLNRETPFQLLSIRINGHEQSGIYQFLLLPDGRYAATAENIQEWHLLPHGQGIEVDGQHYYPLSAISGTYHRLEPQSQTLLLEAPATAFIRNTVTTDSALGIHLQPSSMGGFFNYDLQWQQDSSGDTANGLFEIGAFNHHGVGIVTALWNNDSAEHKWLRMDTSWTMDMPQQMRTLRLGDSIGRGSSWGRSVRYGGIQWGTNFATRPDFITFPTPAFRGEASLPSTLDVYVNNVRRLHSEVLPGPFDIPEMPLITGQGEVRMVITDILGREQVVSSPYYASASLLRPGLHEFTLEAGAIREDYGLANANYGRAMLAFTDKLGITDQFTREFRMELLRDQQTLGASGIWLWPGFGTTSLATAYSNSLRGHGGYIETSAERQARSLSMSFRATYAERDYTQLGTLSEYSLRHRITANIGIPIAGNGLGISFLHQSTWQDTDTRLLSANYSMSFGKLGYLGMYASRNFSQPATTMGITFIHSLDTRTSATASLTTTNNEQDTTLQLQRNLPAGNGFGYQLTKGQGRLEREEASGTLRTDYGDLSASARRRNGKSNYRIGANGGVAVLEGRAFISRRIDDSFAVVKVGDIEGVRVYRENQEIGRTGPGGMVLVTRLRAYQRNAISVEQADLPLDAEVDKLHLTLTTSLRSGVLGEIPLRKSRSATFRIVDGQGQPLPPGTPLRMAGQVPTFLVGYDGQSFASGLGKGPKQIWAQWDGRTCIAELPAMSDNEPIPDLGSIACTEEAK